MTECLVLSLPYSRILFHLSHLSLLIAIIGYLRGYPHLAVVPGSVYISSILYWRNPIKNSIWRKLDICIVALAFSYQKVLIFTSQAIAKKEYWILMFIAVSCYPISNHCRQFGEAYDTFFHSLIHIFANMANLSLYYTDNQE